MCIRDSKVSTNTNEEFISHNVLLAIGRRGSPRKLNVPGEDLPKVAYRLLEPENITGKKVIVVGGGDSGLEYGIMLMDQNEVSICIRDEVFPRCKPKNKELATAANESGKLKLLFKSGVVSIAEDSVLVLSLIHI